MNLPWIRRAMAPSGELQHVFFIPDSTEGDHPLSQIMIFAAVCSDRARMHWMPTDNPPRIPGGEPIFAISPNKQRFTFAEFSENTDGRPPGIAAVMDLCEKDRELDMDLWWDAGAMHHKGVDTSVVEHFETGTKLNVKFYEDIVEGDKEDWQSWLCVGIEEQEPHMRPIYFKHRKDDRHALVMPFGYTA